MNDSGSKAACSHPMRMAVGCSPKPYCNRRLKRNDWVGYRAAGVLPYWQRNKQIHVLLGYGQQKPRDRPSYHVLGGKIESCDPDLYATAQREFDEESGFFFRQRRAAAALNRSLRRSPILWIPECKMGLVLLNINRCPRSLRQSMQSLDLAYRKLRDRDFRTTPFLYLQWVALDRLEPLGCNFVARRLLKHRSLVRSWNKSEMRV